MNLKMKGRNEIGQLIINCFENGNSSFTFWQTVIVRNFMMLLFLTTSHVVIVVLRIIQLFLLFSFSIFLISDAIPLFSIDLSCSCKRMAILKVEVQILSPWAWLFWEGGVKRGVCYEKRKRHTYYR